MTLMLIIPWIRTEFKNLPKDFPNFLQNTDGFTKECTSTVRTCDPGDPNLIQLIYLLISGSKTK